MYTDSSIVSDYLQRTLTAQESDTLAMLIPAVSKWIDNHLGTTFNETDEVTTREYDGEGGSILTIDPCTSITSVVGVNQDFDTDYAYDADDYVAMPQNDTVKTWLRKRAGRWPRGIANIAVTAIYGSYDAEAGGIPEDIQLIATRIVAGIIRGTYNDDNSEGIKRETIEGHSVEYSTSSDNLQEIAMGDPLVKSLLAARREILLG